MDLHQSTNGASWKKSDGWGTSSDYCTWFGVSCNHDPPGTSQVYSVILGANNLKGPIPASVIKMKSLKVLDLSDNQLTGEVPSGFETLPDLQQVLLNKNSLSGHLPAMMMNLTVNYPPMQQIDLSYNKITGPIPETLFGPEKLDPFAPTDNLQVFNLRYNAITGNIPERISRAATMVSILFGGNNMTGTIDKALGPFLTSRKYC